VRTQEVNQWHCQTGLLIASSVAENLSLLRANKNFSKPGGSVTNPNAAAAVGQCAALSKGRQACIKTAPERCIPSTAPSAGTMQWCHSGPGVTVPFTAATASARCAQSLPPVSNPTRHKGRHKRGLAKCQPSFVSDRPALASSGGSRNPLRWSIGRIRPFK